MIKHKLQKGILIAIEGIDGAGKTTQTARLRDHYNRLGFNVCSLKEPTNSPFGQKIRELAINGRQSVTGLEELELFINDRILDCSNNIGPALNNNQLVLIDRYYFSNIAYQGALGLDKNYILKRNEEIAIPPDMVIILDLSVKIGLSRIENYRKENHNHFEKEDYLEKVRKIFLEMNASYIQLIDASRDEYTVFNNIKNIVQDIVAPHIYLDDNQFDLFERKIEKNHLVFINN
jgi:dTMP kinase